ncbi:DUF2508 family protein [Natranaerobius thermophilus]|uniref:DUF2508 family protein n=1 Tax=Natranaerobius thermophilus (strain ATCC BAA-1301 / DSM 18059 / JW/NM-WN-LF) TaxID=457570 RepID=B2A303_NATTJ|nr:DUF2508 family protein [Natranaerobius thermophilus]ACB83617.1 hypothetical protein Nther_0018 [Natranaerobius thermophilus JW/NM-WN-LF]
MSKLNNFVEYKDKLVAYLCYLYHHFDLIESNEDLTWEDQLLNELKRTEQEIENAKKYFNSVTDPGLIEHAIYLIKASERKYRYLINQAKKMGVEGKLELKKSNNLS